MSYLRREKPDSNLKKADICGDFWDFWDFTMKRCHICDAPCASHKKPPYSHEPGGYKLD